MIYQNNLVEIIPAILPHSAAELKEGLQHLRGVSKKVQVDLVGTNIFAGQVPPPPLAEFDFELDVMLPDPARECAGLLALGPSRIVIHVESAGAYKALEQLQSARRGELAVEVGVALAAHDTPEALLPFAGLYDFVQVMGIDHIGAQGEPPDPHHKDVELVAAVRRLYPTVPLQADGAVAPRARELALAGASRLVVGSAIMTADNPKQALQALYTEANAQ